MNELFEMDIDDLMKIRITSSTLTDESLKTVPSSMTVFTREYIRRLGLQNLHELVNLVPGYQSSRHDDATLNYGMSSRGRRLGSSGREILVLMDGQRLNDDWTGGAGLHDHLISLENVERIEFIRGPGSAIYGSNALTGVINIITSAERNVQAQGGSHQSRAGSLQWQAQSEQGEIQIYARNARSAGETLQLPEPFPNPATPVFVEGHDGWRAEDLYLRGRLGEFTLAARAAARDEIGYYDSGFVADDSSFYDTRTYFWNLGWNHAFNDQWSLSGHVFRAGRDLTIQAPIVIANTVPFTPVLNLRGVANETEVGTQWIVQGSLGSGRGLLGWEWRNPEQVDTTYETALVGNPFGTPTDQAEEGQRFIRGTFVQWQQPLPAELELTVGLRHDAYSDFGEHSSPRLALVQQWGTANTVKVMYSEAFRAPSWVETRVFASPQLQGNPNLEPEVARTAEAVWLYTHRSGYFTATYFDTQLHDAIIESVTPSLQRTWINSDQQVHGVEIETLWHLNSQWQTRVAITHLLHPASERSGESETLFGGSVSYQIGSWTAAVLANYQGEKVDANEQDFPADITTVETTHFGGRTLWAAHLNYQPVPQLDCYLHVDNLFDKEYLSPANRPTNAVGAPGTGRVITAGVRWEFL